MTYQYLFGPVPSRRLGISLGVDLVPHKICTLNCVYCECGATTELTLDRREYVSHDKVIKELDDYLTNYPEPDYITFSGSGEPTLNLRIGEVILYIKDKYPKIKIAVLTNGTLFIDPEVRRSLLQADVVLPSIDAATREAFLRLNRPHHDLDHKEHIKGLIRFRKEFKGKIWLEVFLLEGYNDNSEDLTALKSAIERIKPDIIQLNTLDRPGALPGLTAVSFEKLNQIKDLWFLPNIEIIAPVSERQTKKSFREDIENAVLETISRRPCTLKDLSHILRIHENEINKYLSTLDASGKIEALNMNRGVFYQLKRTQ
ncbi:MAG: radical SAM protein [Candidatus Neomarinimicrobiota bacterium]|nr:MAG: radical SAM protein [Candidatus Neomarinimicrobiota bacterium]